MNSTVIVAAGELVYLQFLTGSCKGQRIDISHYESLMLGREKTLAVVEPNFTITDRTLSRRHLRLTASPNSLSFYLEDLDSSNGTFVNGRRLKPFQQIRLVDGDEIEAGENLLRFVDTGSTKMKIPLRRDSYFLEEDSYEEPQLPPGVLTSKGGFQCIEEKGQIWLNGQLLSLTPKQFQFLRYLYKHRSRVCTYQELLQNIWQLKAEPSYTEVITALGPNNVQQLVSDIRRKIDQLKTGLRGDEVIMYNSAVRGYQLGSGLTGV